VNPHLTFFAVLLAIIGLGAVFGAGLGLVARRLDRSPAALGWSAVLLLMVASLVLIDGFDRGFMLYVLGLALLGWPLGGFVGERIHRRWGRAHDVRHEQHPPAT
jgi:hypothetical protein